VPGVPAGTVITVVSPGGTMGAEGRVQGLSVVLPVFFVLYARWSDVSALASRPIDLLHRAKVVLVLLTTQSKLGFGEACHIRTLQDLVFLLAVILPMTPQFDLEARHGGIKTSSCYKSVLSTERLEP